MSGLVLSIFPGIGMLDMAFELEGFTVVRGPDVLWGGDIRRFHVPTGVFAGVIGGPPCQEFSALAALVRANGHQPRFGNLIPEFERNIREAQPAWFIMENVRGAPLPVVDGYQVHAQLIENRDIPGLDGIGEEQNRTRRISFGTRDGRPLYLQLAALQSPVTVVAVHSGHSEPHAAERNGYKVQEPLTVTSAMKPWGAGGQSGAAYRKRMQTVSTADQHSLYGEDGGAVHYKVRNQETIHSGHDRTPSTRDRNSAIGEVARTSRYKLPDACRLQGLPEDFLKDAPFTAEGKLRCVANGVPIPMGRAIAQAVKRAMGL